MTKLLIIIAVLGFDVFAGMTSAVPIETDDDMSEAQRLMKSLNPIDRGNFVTYHLTLEAERQGRFDIEVVHGYERMINIKQKDYSTIAVPENFGRNLLAWSEAVMVKPLKWLSRIDPMHGVKVCFPSGCADPNDVGSNCCPF